MVYVGLMHAFQEWPYRQTATPHSGAGPRHRSYRRRARIYPSPTARSSPVGFLSRRNRRRRSSDCAGARRGWRCFSGAFFSTFGQTATLRDGGGALPTPGRRHGTWNKQGTMLSHDSASPVHRSFGPRKIPRDAEPRPRPGAHVSGAGMQNRDLRLDGGSL